MWESQEAAERFYSGEWLAGIRARYGTEPKISYFETVALTDKASGQRAGSTDRRGRTTAAARCHSLATLPRVRRQASGVRRQASGVRRQA
jgi:hypothetical protein